MSFDSFVDGDVALLEQERSYDIHAVAGLFKLFLREQPLSLLTNELHRDFLNVTDLLDRSDRIIELARLVSYLPVANYTLLRVLVAHLITVVQMSNVNKMTAHNVGIVFSPTLGIPAGIFTLMMTEFEFVFWVHSDATELEQMRQQFRSHQEKMKLATLVRENTMEPLLTPSKLVESTLEQESIIAQKRRRWRADEVVVQGRSNRNSKIYLENAPESVKLSERMAMISKEDPEGAYFSGLSSVLTVSHFYHDSTTRTERCRRVGRVQHRFEAAISAGQSHAQVSIKPKLGPILQLLHGRRPGPRNHFPAREEREQRGERFSCFRGRLQSR